MTKIIKLKLLTQQDLVVVETNATTLGEFKKEEVVQALNIDWASTKLIDRTTKVTLDLDETVMPSVDSIMFVTPTKTKSGADLSYKEAKEQVKNLVDAGKIDKVNWMGKTTQDLNKILEEANAVVEEKPIQLIDSINEEAIIQELTVLLKKAGKKLKKLSKVTGRNTTSLVDHVAIFKQELADFVTKDDLTLEAESLAHRF